MSEFLTPLRCEKVWDSDDKWILLEDLLYRSYLTGEIITAPKGFETDFASTPQAVWMFFPKDGRWDGAAVIHDFLYHTHPYPREICDGIFLEALTVLKVSPLKRNLMYWAVRSWGWLFYGR